MQLQIFVQHEGPFFGFGFGFGLEIVSLIGISVGPVGLLHGVFRIDAVKSCLGGTTRNLALGVYGVCVILAMIYLFLTRLYYFTS